MDNLTNDQLGGILRTVSIDPDCQLVIEFIRTEGKAGTALAVFVFREGDEERRVTLVALHVPGGSGRKSVRAWSRFHTLLTEAEGMLAFIRKAVIAERQATGSTID